MSKQYKVPPEERLPISKRAMEQIKDPCARSVYIALVKFVDWETMTGWASDIIIAEYVGCSTTTAYRKRKLLKKYGWIDWKQQRNKSNSYIVYTEGQLVPKTIPDRRKDDSIRLKDEPGIGVKTNYSLSSLPIPLPHQNSTSTRLEEDNMDWEDNMVKSKEPIKECSECGFEYTRVMASTGPASSWCPDCYDYLINGKRVGRKAS